MPSVMEMAYAETEREKYALARGLPEDSSWQVIREHDSEAWRKRKVLRYGLPADTFPSAIFQHERKLRREAEIAERQADARELGLLETATLEDIAQARAALPIGLFHETYPVDSFGRPETDDSDLG